MAGAARADADDLDVVASLQLVGDLPAEGPGPDPEAVRLVLVDILGLEALVFLEQPMDDDGPATCIWTSLVASCCRDSWSPPSAPPRKIPS
jgi:hypothetical protein